MTRRQAKKIFHIWVLEPHRCGPYKLVTYRTARRKLRRTETRNWRKNLRELTPERRRRFACIRIPIV